MVTKKLSLSLRCADKQEFHEPFEPAAHEVSTESSSDRGQRARSAPVTQLRHYFEPKRWRQAQLQEIAVRRPIEYDSRMYCELILTGRQQNCSRSKINLGHNLKLVRRKINQRFIRARRCGRLFK